MRECAVTIQFEFSRDLSPEDVAQLVKNWLREGVHLEYYCEGERREVAILERTITTIEEI